MKTLVVVPCGRSKIWRKKPRAGPTRARSAYAGAPFKVNREYAETFADEWVVLSAKYGFIGPEFLIPGDYDVTFKKPSTNPISMEALRTQAREGLSDFDCIVALGGKTYADIVSRVFRDMGKRVSTPVAGLSIGKAMGKVKGAVRRGEPFTC